MTTAAQSIRPNLIIDVSRVSKVFPTANGSFEALKDVSLKCRAGQLVAITGKSGSGKSTMLNILSGIDKPTRGRVSIAGVSIPSLNEGELARWRGRNVGIVFQFFQLIPTLTVIENVMLPMDFCNTYLKKERRERALELLDEVGIAEQADKLPAMLSGGQQQRVSIARALANDPPILMADEPTGNLDTKNGEAVFTLLTDLATAGKTVVVVTHEKELSRYFKNIYEMIDGRIQRINGPDMMKEVGYAT